MKNFSSIAMSLALIMIAAVGCGSLSGATDHKGILYHFDINDFDINDGLSLIVDPNSRGVLYGTNGLGGLTTGACKNLNGCGTVFKLTPTSSGYVKSTLYRFRGGNDGAGPNGPSIDSTGALYGTTQMGGIQTPCCDGHGTVFKLTPSASGYTESILYRFRGGNDGEGPDSVIIDKSGALYGVAAGGGDGLSHAAGEVFKLTPSGGGYVENVIYRFQGGYKKPYSSTLTVDSNGVLYGTTTTAMMTCDRNVPVCGTIFKLTPSASGYTGSILYRFQSERDGAPSSLIASINGVLYGTTIDGTTTRCNIHGFPVCGTIFKLTPSRSGYIKSRLYSSQDTKDGALSLIGYSNGMLYGMRTGLRMQGGYGMLYGSMFKFVP
jgi:hypothetical protein